MSHDQFQIEEELIRHKKRGRKISDPNILPLPKTGI
jgi:hypothetical protein